MEIITNTNGQTKNDKLKEWLKLNEPKPKEICLHDICTECHGTGRKSNGTPCVHMISCTCSKCSPKYGTLWFK